MPNVLEVQIVGDISGLEKSPTICTSNTLGIFFKSIKKDA